MDKQYRNEMDQICLTEESKKIIIQNLVNRQTKPSKPLRAKKMSLKVVAAICLLVFSTTAIAIGFPVLQAYFDGNGYKQSSAIIGKAVTQNGWSMTLTDCVGDDRYLYLGLELAAPEGTVLDKEAYYFEQYDVSFLGMQDYIMAGSLMQVPDEDGTDNLLHFIFRIEGGYYDDTFNGKIMKLSLGNLYHTGDWNEAESRREHLLDSEAEWKFNAVKVDYPDNAIRLKPDINVTVLDVEAKITSIEVSPIGVVVTMEGDELKGHHEWVAKDAPDGWYSCIEQPIIILYDKEGKPLEPDEQSTPFGIRAGSGCWGGLRHNDEPGKLKIVQSYGYLLDMDVLDYVDINGVRIQLAF